MLLCDYVEGDPLTELWRRAGLVGKVVLASRTARFVARLYRAGVSHIDMNATNYLGIPDGEIHPVAFSDAVVRSPLGAGAADSSRSRRRP